MNAFRSKSVVTSTRVFAALAFALTVVLAGCSQEDDPGVASLGDDSTSSSSAPTESSEKSVEKYEACLVEHGVDPDDTGFSVGAPATEKPEDDLSPAEEQAVADAQDACEKYLPVRELSEEEHSELLEGALKHAQCLRDKGFDVPDPEMVDGGVMLGFDDSSGIDPEDPEFQKADQECAEKFMPEPEDLNESGDGA